VKVPIEGLSPLWHPLVISCHWTQQEVKHSWGGLLTIVSLNSWIVEGYFQHLPTNWSIVMHNVHITKLRASNNSGTWNYSAICCIVYHLQNFLEVSLYLKYFFSLSGFLFVSDLILWFSTDLQIKQVIQVFIIWILLMPVSFKSVLLLLSEPVMKYFA